MRRITRRLVAFAGAIVLAIACLAGAATAHEGPTNGYFRSIGTNGPISYGNPSFTVHDGIIELDVVWTPTGQPWPQPPAGGPSGLQFVLVGYDADGVVSTAPYYFDFNCSSDCSNQQSPEHFSATIFNADVAAAPQHSLEIWADTTKVAVARDVECAQSTATRRISLSSEGIQQANDGGGGSSKPVVSGDGTSAVFASSSSNLVANDTNGVQDIFVRDRTNATTTRVSVSSSGAEANGRSIIPSISDDGRFVVFQSIANNLVPGDTNNFEDIFVHDLLTGSTRRASVSSSGDQANNASSGPAISGDGTVVAFESRAWNLTPDGVQNQVFVHDLEAGSTVLGSANSSEAPGNANATTPSLSDDGRVLAFSTRASNLAQGDSPLGARDVFVKDLITQSVERASTSSTGTEGDGPSDYPSLSGRGTSVAFSSEASNLVSGDSNGLEDVFYRSLGVLGSTRRVSVSSSGTEASGASSAPALSGDGSTVVFESWARDLVSDDTAPEYRYEVFAHSLSSGETALISRNIKKGAPNADSWGASLSTNGKLAGFHSQASDVVCWDDNRMGDAFVAPVALGGGTSPLGGSGSPVTSYVAMGDSYSSGEGVQPYFAGSDTAQDRCHRSEAAYPNFVQSPEDPRPLRQRDALGEPVSWAFIACAGATTDNVISGGQDRWTEPPQLDQGVVTPATELVTLTIGGNDVMFSEVLNECALPDCLDPAAQMNGQPFKDWLDQMLAGVGPKVKTTLDSIKGIAPDARVVLLGYPRLFPPFAEERTACPRLIVSGFSSAEQTFLNEKGAELNDVLAAAAGSAGAEFVDMQEPFSGHEVCGRLGEWINGPYIALDGTSIEGEDRSFHPNEAGQAVGYGNTVNSYLRGTLPLPRQDAWRPTWRSGRAAAMPGGSLGPLRVMRVKGCAELRARISGDGFAPGTTVDLVLHSVGGASALGFAQVDERGRIAQTLVLMDRARAGGYALQATGSDDADNTRRLTGNFRIKTCRK